MFGVKYNHLRAKSGRLDSFWRSFDNATLSAASLRYVICGHTPTHIIKPLTPFKTTPNLPGRSGKIPIHEPQWPGVLMSFGKVHRMSFIHRILCPCISMGTDLTNTLPSARSSSSSSFRQCRRCNCKAYYCPPLVKR